MATTRPSFKDYEYGFYGFHCAYNNHFMKNTGVCQLYQYRDGRKMDKRSMYEQTKDSTLGELTKLKGVVFTHGDYKDVV